jgi:hypothetical protein
MPTNLRTGNDPSHAQRVRPLRGGLPSLAACAALSSAWAQQPQRYPARPASGTARPPVDAANIIALDMVKQTDVAGLQMSETLMSLGKSKGCEGIAVAQPLKQLP